MKSGLDDKPLFLQQRLLSARFFFILLILEARAEIVKKHQSLLGRIEDKENGFETSWPLTASLQGKQSSDI